jgi:uncharacterized LabA/DUF88 family protein
VSELQGRQNTAVLIDYENVSYFLKNTFRESAELSSYTTEIIRNLRLHLEEKLGLRVIVMNAYADFERVGGGALGALYLMGVLSHNILGTAHRNAADMQLCIDLMQLLYTRNDIDSFVLVGGDRDYIPVVQHLKRNGRQVWVSAFRDTLSGDLLEIIGESQFIDIWPMLSPASLEKLNANRVEEDNRRSDVPRLAGPRVVGQISLNSIQRPRPYRTPSTTPTVNSVENEDGTLSPMARECMMCILQFINERRMAEPGITLLLRYLTDAMPQLANWERKSILEQLQVAGVLSVEQRPGVDYPYSVAVVNYNHQAVQDLVS